ncbi:MAG: tyrosine-type recombinase/integrase [Caldiserica bacterium]|nr:tyrosine-type recombinase/integrase [Caldisericota bacterium]
MNLSQVTQFDQSSVFGLVLDSVDSNNSKIAYLKALQDYVLWSNGQVFTKATVQAFKVYLQGKVLSASSINLKLSAIRKMALEASDNNLLDPVIAGGISRVSCVKQSGTRTGNWLTKEQAQQLLDAVDTSTAKGKRDLAIFAVMLGCGLRRSEVVSLRFDQIQQRDGRWVIVDIIGKGGRVRTVPMPSWCKVCIDNWQNVSQTVESKAVFSPVLKGGHIQRGQMTKQAILKLVQGHSEKCGFKISPHDLRRTFAKLAYKGSSPIDQIQLSLGHSSIVTTERYLGVKQDFNDAPCDRLGLATS